MNIYDLIYKYKFLIKNQLYEVKKMSFFFIILSFLEVAGIGLIGPYITMLIDESRISSIKNTLNIQDFSNNSVIIITGVLLIFIFFLKAILTIFINYKITSFSENIQYFMRINLMKNLFNSDYNYINKKNSPYYLNLFQNSIPQCAFGMTQSINRILCEVIVLFVMTIYLLFISPIALISIASALFLFAFIFDKYFRTKLSYYGELIYKSSILCFRYFNEALFGFKSIKVLQKDNFFQNLLSREAFILRNSSIKASVISNSPKSLIELILVSIVVFFSIIVASLNFNTIEFFPILSMFALAALRIIPSVNTLSNCFNQIRLNTNSINYLYDEFSSQHKDLKFNSTFSLKKISNFEVLNIINLSFKYPDTNIEIFKNFNITINKNDIIGIVGESGSGKSTLIDLVLGFQIPDSGDFILNDIKIDPSSDIWREKVAFIPQEIFLIDGTILDNITLGVDSNKIVHEHLDRSLHLSQLNEVISNFPNGLSTFVGENGSLLSGGQRQRIALARAIYHNRKFLILDESTSSIDKKTEMEFIKELNNLKGSVTVMIISHTPEILECCNKIYKIENKNIIKIK